MKRYLPLFALALLAGALTLGAYKTFFEQPVVRTVIANGEQLPVARVVNLGSEAQENFVTAAERSLNAVVHITTAVEARRYYVNPFEQFFFGNPGRHGQPEMQMQSGSGVIMSPDGYIITNNHVVNGAESILVTLNDNRELEAEIVGTDPTTDLALLKVKASDLPTLDFGNSDDIRVGEWVLAVGNPFNLNSTVTAGIVSAKGRAIDIINEQTAIESFIQTDAVVNPGNSGGALVNLKGELVGINTAISTHTGTFEGYSFAVPANIVRKVMEDLLEYGVAQRAFIGVNISDLNPRIAQELGLETDRGVYVGGVTEGGAAEASGLKAGDVIVSVDGTPVSKTSKLQELIGRKRPGDKVVVGVDRKGTQQDFEIVLRNRVGTTERIKRDETGVFAVLGGSFESLTAEEKKMLGLPHGVKVTDVSPGKLRKAGVPKGFIITKINNSFIKHPRDIEETLSKLQPGDGVLVQGFLPNGRPDYFAFGY